MSEHIKPVKTVFQCSCGCGTLIYEEDNKLWMTSLMVNKEQVLNMKKGLVNGKHSIMQPTGAVAILKWLDAHKESKDD